MLTLYGPFVNPFLYILFICCKSESIILLFSYSFAMSDNIDAFCAFTCHQLV